MSTPSAGPESQRTRRQLFQTAAAATAATAVGGLVTQAQASAGATATTASSGRIKQSVCRWCYGKISLDDLCVAAKRMGLVGIDLLGPADFQTIKKHGLICTMVGSHPLDNGLADPKYWEASLKAINAAIEATSREGWRNVICFSGNRRGIDDKTGMDNCVKALKEIVPVAEKANVILNMELLNSKVDHKDYMCDHSTWGVELVKRVGSDNFKLLYDIYHMQIMEGDVIRTIRKDHDALRPLPHRRQPRPQRDRRHPGAELHGHRPGHRRHRLPGLHRPRVHPASRSADEPGRGRRAVHRVRHGRVLHLQAISELP